ncbi:MAG: hypothetical protein ACI4KJ_05675 [Anaerovoracaceae bacterium]
MTGRKDTKEYTSADYQAIAREHKDALETNRRIFLRSGLFVILTALVIIIAVLGWFVMNNRTEAITSLISAKSSRYTLTTPGTEVGFWERGGTTLEFDITDSMMISDDSNFKNTGETSKLAPGSFGEIELEIDPTATDLRGIELTIDTNLQFRSGEGITIKDTDKTKASNYVSGHILFFTNKDGRYYSGWIGPDSAGKYKFTIPSEDFQDESGKTTKKVKQKVYWIWPQQFHNYVYAGGGSYYRNLFASEGSAGYLKLIEDLNYNKYRYFDGSLSVGTISSDMSGSDYDACTDAFNAADQLIGEAVDFIQIRINTSENGGGA